MGDVDALGELEPVRAGDVRVVLAQEPAPGELDRLGTGVAGHTEAGIQVVAGQRLTGGMVAQSYWRAGRRSLSLLLCDAAVAKHRGTREEVIR